MTEVKTYLISGRIRKPNLKTTFKKRIRALKPEDAIEEIFKTLGSKHRVKRYHIKIERIEEAKDDQADS
ncbi:MAG: 50S ribosomal protein L18Ae [Nitrososphaerota archaeon]|nr:50S ribosomal protein L18Ae [Candidatus Bathyarchaeota archaeon]MDW8048825.1 50S ribosomal protein L18Ae [Nitrososphaerota archaeon]